MRFKQAQSLEPHHSYYMNFHGIEDVHQKDTHTNQKDTSNN